MSKPGNFAESLKQEGQSSGDPKAANDVPGVRETSGMLEQDARPSPEGQSPTNWSRYGSGTDDFGISKEEIAKRRARVSRVDG